MVLDLIKKEIENYKQLIASPKYDEMYKWEALKNFQDNWNIEEEDFKTMYNRSLSNPISNLWASSYWFPKSVMLQFIDYDKERVRQMFIDLFNEEKNIDKRIDHFVFHCDEMLEKIAENDLSIKNHFHDGQRIISLYLAFKYPEKYSIYKFTEFKVFMTAVKARDIPGRGEYERFLKVSKILYNMMIKDEELMRLHKALLTDNCYKGETLMLAQDLIFSLKYVNL